ncbi:MAG: hypothetical protein KUG69_14470 [Marinosulfonomonas sp.]|nr:hypothetical protein [Marinosulfonomonas sp.]
MTAHVKCQGLKQSVPNAKSNGPQFYLNLFRRDESGSILIFSLFLFVLMLMISGMAVDLMRSETHRTRLQSTLDRSVLAAASLDQALDSEDVVRDYFQKAGLDSYLTDVTVVPGLNSKTVTATAEMGVGTFFMHMMGIPEITAPAAGEAEESLTNIEVSLILDVSGSMGGWSDTGGARKLALLQDASKDFVYLMQCNPDDDDACTVEANTVSISLIPYAEQVLAGETLIQEFNVTNEHTHSSCADFDQADFNETALPLFSIVPGAPVLKRAATIDKRSNYRSNRSNSVWASGSRRTCRTDDYREISALNNSYADLQDRIDDLRAGGYTSIDMGMKWGAALLDPAFRPAVSTSLSVGANPEISPAFSDRPYDFRAPSMQKIIVLMTDGKNTTQHVVRDDMRSGLSPFFEDPNDNQSLSALKASTGQYYQYYQDSWKNEPKGGSDAVQLTYPDFWARYNVDFYEEAFSFLPDPSLYYGSGSKNTRLDLICDEAKAQGIKVFTIGFETSSSSSAVMRSCASSSSHHFDVDGLSLDDAFASIARDIHALRLVN